MDIRKLKKLEEETECIYSIQKSRGWKLKAEAALLSQELQSSHGKRSSGVWLYL